MLQPRITVIALVCLTLVTPCFAIGDRFTRRTRAPLFPRSPFQVYYAGPTFSTIEIDTVQSVSPSGDVVTFTQPGSSTVWELKFDPNFRWFWTYGMSSDATAAMKKAFELKRDMDIRRTTVPTTPTYRIFVDGVFSWFRYYPGRYTANEGSVLRFEQVPTQDRDGDGVPELLETESSVVSSATSATTVRAASPNCGAPQ